MAACRDERMVEVRLRAIGGSVGETYKSGCAAAQEDATGLCGFLFDL